MTDGLPYIIRDDLGYDVKKITGSVKPRTLEDGCPWALSAAFASLRSAELLEETSKRINLRFTHMTKDGPIFEEVSGNIIGSADGVWKWIIKGLLGIVRVTPRYSLDEPWVRPLFS